MATQIKGLKHCDYIRKQTFDMFVEYNMNIPWKECMWRALRLHREALVKAMKSKIIIAPSLKLNLNRPQQQQHPRISEAHVRQQRMCGSEHPHFFGGWGENA